jgi:hypothetical protein
MTKKSGNEINDIEIINKKDSNKINNINENHDESQNKENIQKKESFNIFEDESLIYHKKGNLSEEKNSINPNKDENNLLYNINIQFSKIGKPNENDLIKDNNDNFDEDHIINLTDKNILNNNKKKNTKNIILKRFEEIKKNENNKINSESPNFIKENSRKKNIIINNEQINDKISKNYMTNSTNENNYIYLCPFCSKETPEIKKIEGNQIDINSQTIDKIFFSCSCGDYELNLNEYINKIEQQNELNYTKDFCYNENHDYIKGSNYCSKCDKWFCQQCLLYHKFLL